MHANQTPRGWVGRRRFVQHLDPIAEVARGFADSRGIAETAGPTCALRDDPAPLPAGGRA